MTCSAEIEIPIFPQITSLLPIVKIEPAIEWMRYCEECEWTFAFVANRICPAGHIGHCTRCGAERIAPFTRASLEAN